MGTEYNRLKGRRNMRRYRTKNRERLRIIDTENCYKKYQENPEKKRKDTRNCYYRLKWKTLVHYSGTDPPHCTCCGITEMSMLTIDHLNNDGNHHRKNVGGRSGYRLYQYLKKQGFPDNLNLTVRCFNCNISRYYLGECAHKLGPSLENKRDILLTKEPPFSQYRKLDSYIKKEM